MSTLILKYNNGDLADVELDFAQVTSVLPNRKITASGNAAVGIAVRDTGDKRSPGNFFLARLFLDVPDTNIWLTNPAPAGFLRWEGPVLLPTDPLIRVDLLSGEKSNSAEPVKSKSE